MPLLWRRGTALARTIEMTMRYAHLSPDVPRHAVTLLDGLGSSAAPAPNAGRQVATRAGLVLNYLEL
jgi:hypothetical protein